MLTIKLIYKSDTLDSGYILLNTNNITGLPAVLGQEIEYYKNGKSKDSLLLKNCKRQTSSSSLYLHITFPLSNDKSLNRKVMTRFA